MDTRYELPLPLAEGIHFFGHLSGNRVLFSRARDFILDPDATSTRRNYLV